MRKKGSLSLSSNIEPSMAAPLDAREVVDKLSDLTASGSFPYLYVGIKVFVKENKKTYELLEEDATNINNWRIFGAEGKSAYDIAVDNGFVGTEKEYLASLKGVQGQKGDRGQEGKTPVKGVDYWTQDDINTMKSEADKAATDYLNAHKADFKGEKGSTGASGKSAYELAVAAGFSGTEAQWLTTLKGETGSAGKNGNNGMSAYEIAKKNGYTGTEKEWLASLKGETGDSASSAVLSNPFSASVKVGGVNSGKQYAAGTSLETILMDLLNPTLFPTFTAPSATLTATGAKLLEKGSTLKTTMTVSFNRGTISPAYGTNGYRAGNAISYALNDGTAQTSNSFDVTVSESAKTYQAKVNYGVGVQPKDSKNSNYDKPLAAGSVNTNAINYEFVDALYANTSSINSVGKLALVSKGAKSKQFDFPAQTIANPEEFHIPSDWNITTIQVLNTLSGKWEDCKAEFTKTTTTHKNAAGTNVNYAKYTDNRGYNAGARSIKISWS